MHEAIGFSLAKGVLSRQKQPSLSQARNLDVGGTSTTAGACLSEHSEFQWIELILLDYEKEPKC